VAFVGGLTGRMYQQFALTIAISVLLSAFNALSLSPALAAMLLKPARRPGEGSPGVFSKIYDRTLGTFFRGFNWVFDKTTTGYVSVSRILVRRAILTILIVAAVCVGAGLFGRALPAGFIPDQDQSLLGVAVQLPPGASLERTAAVLTQVEEIVAKTPGVLAHTTIGGYGAVTNTYQPNFGTVFAQLHPWEERHSPELHVKGAIAAI